MELRDGFPVAWDPAEDRDLPRAGARPWAIAAWDASGGVLPDAAVYARHQEHWVADAGKSAAQAPDAPELAVGVPPLAPSAAPTWAALCTPDGVRSAERSCAVEALSAAWVRWLPVWPKPEALLAARASVVPLPAVRPALPQAAEPQDAGAAEPLLP